MSEGTATVAIEEIGDNAAASTTPTAAEMPVDTGDEPAAVQAPPEAPAAHKVTEAGFRMIINA